MYTTLGTEITGYYFNSALDQVLYCSQGKWYLSEDGKDGEAIGVKDVMLYEYNSRWEYEGYGDSTFLLLYRQKAANLQRNKTLTDRFYYSEYGLYYLDQDGKAEELADNNANFPTAVKNGKEINFQDNDRLKKVRASDLDDDSTVAKNVSDYAVTSDGKGVYYVDDDAVLWYQKGSGKPKEVAEDVSGVTVTHDDKVLFLAEESGDYFTLYTVKGSGKPRQLLEDVYWLGVGESCTYCWVLEDRDDGFTVYAAADGTDFEPMIEEFRP